MFDIQENLKKLPDAPGVYLHKDKLGKVIYVGKAISIKKRVRQYFQSSKNIDYKVQAMVKNIEEFEYIKCGNEMEALILENNLIKKYMPKYNVLLRDDKTYPYIKITKEKWPRIQKVREMKKDGGKYFGPYSDVKSVNSIVELLNQTYRLKRCSLAEVQEGFRPCLNYHINQCDGMCAGYGDYEEYMIRAQEMEEFLKGKQKKLLNKLTEEMDEASSKLEFEKAAVLRDRLTAAKVISEKQSVVLYHTKYTDLILYGGKGNIILFFIRDGKLSGRETFSLDIGVSVNEDEVIGSFIKQHYSEMPNGPSEILISREIEDKDLLEKFLFNCWNKNIRITVPKKGERKAFLEMAKKDVLEIKKVIEEKENYKRKRENNIREQLDDVIEKARVKKSTREIVNNETGEIIDLKRGAKKDIYRVEAYDISNTFGVDNIGVMVVFEGLKANKNAYRRFKIRDVDGQNDYGAMQEVIRRRILRAISGDLAFLPLPDLILIDGGKGHVEAVRKTLDEISIEIPIAGMVKDDSHRTRAIVYPKNSKGRSEKPEHDFSTNSLLFTYIGSIQEEVHRFAIEYHKGLRNDRMSKSVLDDIFGIGKRKKAILLKKFKSVDGVKKATRDELLNTEGISKKNVVDIINFFVDKNNDK